LCNLCIRLVSTVSKGAFYNTTMVWNAVFLFFFAVWHNYSCMESIICTRTSTKWCNRHHHMPVAIFTPVNFLSISVPLFMDTWNYAGWLIRRINFCCEPSATPRSHTSVAHTSLNAWSLVFCPSAPWHCIMCAWLLLWHYLCPVISRLLQCAGRRGNKNHSVTESKLCQSTAWSQHHFRQQGMQENDARALPAAL
jgi:hypothetical protein